MSKTKPEFYIINHTDAPSERMIAQRVSETRSQYIHPDLRDWHKKNGLLQITGESTPVENFGVKIEVYGRRCSFCAKHSKSDAKYSDGTTRRWQGTNFFILDLLEPPEGLA